MSSDENLEIRLTFLEDQLDKMNLVLAGQDRRLDALQETMDAVVNRLKALETAAEGSTGLPRTGTPFFGGPSEDPPDGSNR